VIVAMHGGKPIPIGTLKSIVEGSGLDVKTFDERSPREDIRRTRS
jgi:hypothetical protein